MIRLLKAEAIEQALLKSPHLPREARPHLHKLALEMATAFQLAVLPPKPGSTLQPKINNQSEIEAKDLTWLLENLSGQPIPLNEKYWLQVQGAQNVQVVVGDRNVNIQGSVENTLINTGSICLTLDPKTLGELRAEHGQATLANLPLEGIPEPPGITPVAFPGNLIRRNNRLSQIAGNLR